MLFRHINKPEVSLHTRLGPSLTVGTVTILALWLKRTDTSQLSSQNGEDLDIAPPLKVIWQLETDTISGTIT